MSEIKGQLLGVILVLMIFGVVGTAMVGVFTSLKDNVVSSVDSLGDDLGETFGFEPTTGGTGSGSTNNG